MNKDYLINNEKLKKEWNQEKNKNLDINKITLGSNKKAWWKCSKGHDWQTAIVHRKNVARCP